MSGATDQFMARGVHLRAGLLGEGMMARMGRGLGVWRVAPLMLALVLGVSACNKTHEAERPPEPGDVAVARVDGETIWSSDVRNEAVAQGQIGPGEPRHSHDNESRQNREATLHQGYRRAECRDLPQVLNRFPNAARAGPV